MTQEAMNQPRCGVPDVIVPSDVHFHADGSHSRRKRYIIRRKSYLLVQHATKNVLSMQQLTIFVKFSADYFWPKQHLTYRVDNFPTSGENNGGRTITPIQARLMVSRANPCHRVTSITPPVLPFSPEKKTFTCFVI